MEPLLSQVRDYYSQKNQEVYHERELAIKKTGNHQYPYNVYLSTLCFWVSYYRWIISPISVLKQDNDTYQEIGNGKSEGTRESTLLSEIQVDNLNYEVEVLLLGHTCRVNLIWPTRVPLRMKWSHGIRIIALPWHPRSRNSARVTAPPSLTHHMSPLLIKLSESDHAPLTQVLLLPKYCAVQNVLHPKTGGDQTIL